MLKKVINYTDYDGNPRSEVCYFNLSKPELMEMKRSPLYEMQQILDKIRKMEDPDKDMTYAEKDELTMKMGAILRNLVTASYGKKSEDGRRFIKREEGHSLGEEFIETEAYSELYMEMLSDIGNLVGFVREVIPAEYKADFEDNVKSAELPAAE